MTTYKLSIKGPGAINEDYIEMSVLNDSLVVAVSDGMGGMDCGDIAAKTVSESLVKYIIDNEHSRWVLQRLSLSFHHTIFLSLGKAT